VGGDALAQEHVEARLGRLHAHGRRHDPRPFQHGRLDLGSAQIDPYRHHLLAH
jgi:hypothetical protein